MQLNRKTRTNDDDIELEPALEELVLNLLSDGVETDIRGRADFFGHFYVERQTRRIAGVG